MTRFLDVRLSPVGGSLAASVAMHQGTDILNYAGLDKVQLLADIKGRHVLIATHGFNVNRADGIAGLSKWEGQLQLVPPSVFVGLLWPGDSIWAHGFDYPEEPRIANEAADLMAPFIDANFGGAASISFASHSLGARLVLRTISLMGLPVRRATLMAGAIDDNCLNTEFKAAAARIGEVSVLASKKDEVLSAAFPLGNFVAGIIAEGHPWWRAALGHRGPSKPRPGNFQAPFEIPDNWNFGHGDYLRIDSPPPLPPVIALPTDVPPDGSARPADGTRGWQAAWSAAFSATRFR
ncbi:MAG TPA: alpha/beta hydrolase [Bryobacteraceae bacterium]|nr:alpha/beta hydrolase [Bryobacteraceae bacterium]